MTLLIITSSLLLKTGEYLCSSTVGISYEKTKEHRDLSRLIQVAVDGICASTDVYLRNKSEGPPGLHGTFEVTSTEMLHALLAMWPLYCAYQARGISAHQQEWIRNVLWDVGAREYIPKLMSFVRLLFTLYLKPHSNHVDNGNNVKKRKLCLFGSFRWITHGWILIKIEIIQIHRPCPSYAF